MLSQILLIIGSVIFGLLGCIHLIYTLYTDKFNAYSSEVTEAMKGTSPVITKQTTMWQAWVGFNASHSLGLITFAFIYLPLACLHISFLKTNLWLMCVPILVSGAYLLLAKKYWFKVPFLGFFISTFCFIGAFIVNS
ncbi:hypothetical protein Q4489_16215 [Thalassotalea sp. 1_MG-2023]|uniref:LIC_13387 family protein n=1 Tax=Thalassotalea sp. 1_MG-2023 TaxID=3062680 RepID=UPI0026E1C16E|nr:hypothetical protein [Thalassotalea sp. 1_MG-2023]MDO6428558.1 hypothetical protein [Thalassotalea sp. 1_MG-2023]